MVVGVDGSDSSPEAVDWAAERAALRNPEAKVSGEVMPDDAVSALPREGHKAGVLARGCALNGPRPISPTHCARR